MARVWNQANMLAGYKCTCSSINASGDKLTDRGIEQLQAENRQSRLEGDAKEPLRQAIECQLTGIATTKLHRTSPTSSGT